MLSVVTYTYNDHKFINQKLTSLLRFKSIISEIIVVDDASLHPFTLQAGEFSDLTKIIRHKENKGPAYSKKTGLNEAHGEYILSVDADIDFDSMWLFSSLEILNDDNIGLVGASIVNKDYGDSLSRALHIESLVNNDRCKSSFAPGGLWLLKKTVYGQTGGLNGYNQPTHEDWFFSNKIVKMDLSLIINENGTVTQKRKLTRKASIKRDALYSLCCYKSILEKKHPSDFLKFIAIELQTALQLSEKFGCWILVYLKLAKFLLVFGNIDGSFSKNTDYHQAINSFLAVFKSFHNIIQAAMADCDLPEDVFANGTTNESPLYPLFEYMREIIGEECLFCLDNHALPLSCTEENSGDYDFHFAE